MKKILAICLSTIVMASINHNAFAISDTEISDYMQESSKEYSEMLKSNKTQTGDLFFDFTNENKILPLYLFHDNQEDLFKSYDGSNFVENFYDKPLTFIAESKDGRTISVTKLSGETYADDFSDWFGGYFDENKIASSLSDKEVTAIADMKISNVGLRNSPYFLYINTNKGEYIILNKDFTDDLLPNKSLKAFKAYKTDEFVDFCLELLKAKNAEDEKREQDYLDKYGKTEVNAEGEAIETTPKPIASPKATAEPTSTDKPKATLTEKPTKTPKPTATPAPSELTVKGGEEIKISVDGKDVAFDAKPFIDENDRTLVPVRAVSEMLDAKVDWDGETQTVTITQDGKIVKIIIGSDTMTVDTNSIKMDTKAVISEDRTYIPVRFAAEALGLTVNWVE